MRRKITISLLLMACSFGILQAQIPDPVASWNFEETGVMVLDSGLLGLDGVVVDSGSVTRINCGVGQSINFLTAAKSAARVVVPDDPAIDFDLNESFSLSCLAKGDHTLNSGTIETGSWFVQKGVIPTGPGNRGKWYGLELKYYEESYQLRFAVDDQTTKSVATLFGLDAHWDPDIWHHIVGVRDRGEDSLKLYLDGVLVASVLDELNSVYNTTGQPLNIGNSYDGHGQFKGAIDEAAIYNVALSASDVSDLYSSLATSGDCATTDSIWPTLVNNITIAAEDGLDTLVVGDKLKLIITILPSNAYNKGYILSAEPDSVATVDLLNNLTGVSPGSVTVTATARDSGAVVSNSLVINVVESPVGMKETETQDLRVYPIPASNRLNIQLNNNFQGEILRIFDITGREVINTMVDKNLMTIDVSELTKGIYFISIKNHSNTVKQIVIE